MSAFTLGSINPLPVKLGSYQGPMYADRVVSVKLIGDGSDSTDNEALQSGPSGRRRFPFGGPLFSKDDVDMLRFYHQATAPVVFSDPYGERSRVLVEKLQISQLARFNDPDGRWDYTLTLVEVEALGSGS